MADGRGNLPGLVRQFVALSSRHATLAIRHPLLVAVNLVATLVISWTQGAVNCRSPWTSRSKSSGTLKRGFFVSLSPFAVPCSASARMSIVLSPPPNRSTRVARNTSANPPESTSWWNLSSSSDTP